MAAMARVLQAQVCIIFCKLAVDNYKYTEGG